jgi:hypothetical protein
MNFDDGCYSLPGAREMPTRAINHRLESSGSLAMFAAIRRASSAFAQKEMSPESAATAHGNRGVAHRLNHASHACPRWRRAKQGRATHGSAKNGLSGSRGFRQLRLAGTNKRPRWPQLFNFSAVGATSRRGAFPAVHAQFAPPTVHKSVLL